MCIVVVTTLAAGLMGTLAACRIQQVAWKFVRLIAILTLCLLIPVLGSFVLWSGWQRGPVTLWGASLTAGGAMAAFVVLGFAPLSRRYDQTLRLFAAGGAILALAAAIAWGLDYRLWPQVTGWARRAAMAGQLLMAASLGSVTLATVLGHAYLTHTSMTIHPLRRLTAMFAAALTLRTIWAVLVGGGLAWLAAREGHLSVQALKSEWLLLGVRGFIGLLLPLVFSYMVVETARLRATQSATGILYFTLVLVFIGELTSLHLLRELGIAF